MDKLGFIKMLKFCFLNTIKRMKGQGTGWRKFMQSMCLIKKLVSKRYTYLGKQLFFFFLRAKGLNRYFTKYTQISNNITCKDAQYLQSLGKCRLKTTLATSKHLLEWLKLKRLIIISVGKDVAKGPETLIPYRWECKRIQPLCCS